MSWVVVSSGWVFWWCSGLTAVAVAVVVVFVLWVSTRYERIPC